MTEEESKESKSSESKRKSPEEVREKMREKMKEMQEKGGGQAPGAMGGASLMSRLAGMQGGGPQNKQMMKSLKELRADMQEIKKYLRDIRDSLVED